MAKVSKTNSEMKVRIVLIALLILAGATFYKINLLAKPNILTSQLPTPGNTQTSREQYYATYINSSELESGDKEKWLRYRNINQGYSIEFPQSYIVNTYGLKAGILEICSHSPFLGNIYFSSWKNNELCVTVFAPKSLDKEGDEKSLRNFIQKQFGEFKTEPSNGINPSSITWIEVAGQEAAFKKELVGATAYFFNKGYVYAINSSEYSDEHDEVFDQILSTFKFIN